MAQGYEAAGGLQVDTFDAPPALAALGEAVAQRSWPDVAAFLRGLDDPQDVSRALELLGEVEGAEAWLEAAHHDDPRDGLAGTALARRYVGLAWQARTRRRAQDVTAEQADAFFAWLRRAERLLIDVCAEHPGLAAAWVERQLTARGLQLGESEARRRLARLDRVSPHSYPAERHLVVTVGARWGGTFDAALTLARHALDAAGDGHHAGALVAVAHLEHDLDGPAGHPHLSSEAVHAELVDAARRSVLHPDYEPGLLGHETHGLFALAFSWGGHHADAAPHFAYLGDRATDYPWRYCDGPQAEFARFRDLAAATGVAA